VIKNLTTPNQFTASLPHDVRQAALRLARLRIDDGKRLAEESWRAVRVSDGATELVTLARLRAETAVGLEPKSAFCLAVLAATQVRGGMAETALLTLERIADTGAVEARAASIRDAFTALAHELLGHADEARAAYDAFVSGTASAASEFAPLKAELEPLFAPAKPAAESDPVSAG
jgi:hypothetical protein